MSNPSFASEDKHAGTGHISGAKDEPLTYNLNHDVASPTIADDAARGMRILTFTTLFPNRAQPTLGVFVFQRMLHFARRPGNELRVVAPVPYVPGWLPSPNLRALNRIPQKECNAELTVYHPRYPLVPKISMPVHGFLIFLGSLLRVRKLKKEMEFDCIDAHYIYPDGFAAILLAKALSVPVVLSARGTDINLFPSFRLIRPLIRWSLKHAQGLIAVCGPLRDEMIALGAPAEKVRVIGNGVDLKRFWPVEPHEARNYLGLPANQRIIVAVGGLIPRKGFHVLIPAFAEVARGDPSVSLYIIGEGESHAQLQALCAERGVTDRVHLVGSRPNEELRYWFSAAEVSCLTSSREGWPNVLLESMACGTPVIATGIWGVPEVVVSPELGVIVEQSPESIAKGLSFALQKKWNRASIRRHAESRTWDDVAEEVEDYFSACLIKSRQAKTNQ
jgi:teichuronic acid biosynthesis glycosyltransferase TuaC